MIREFLLDIRTCQEMNLDAIGLDITTDENDHCLQNDLELSGPESSQLTDKLQRLSKKFECQRPFLSISDIKLQSKEKDQVCIKTIGLETDKKKFVREGMQLELQKDQWSDSIKPIAFGKRDCQTKQIQVR